MARLVLADVAETLRDHISGVAAQEGLVVTRLDLEGDDPAATARRILSERPDAVLIGAGDRPDFALETVASLELAHPGIWSILIAEPGADMWQRALRSGARDLLPPDVSTEDLREALKRAVERISARPAAPATAAAPADHVKRGRVVTVMSPKGGCGKTMLATNLAYGLHSAGRGQVVIVDYDLQFGDVAGALGLRPEYSVSNAAQVAKDPTATKSFLTPHPSGMFALCAPVNPAEADNIEPTQLETVLGTLQREFDWVIVDTSAGVSEANLTAIEASTDVIMVATTDLAAIQALRKAVLVLDQIGMTDHRRWYLLNRANARVGLEQSDIERSVGLAIDASVPSARAVPVAMNQGVPVLEDDPRSPAARSVREFLEKLAPHDRPGSDDTRGWLQRIRP